MSIPITFIMHWILMLSVLGAGIGFFIKNSIQQEFLVAVISITLPIIFINIYGIITKALSTKGLGYILSLCTFLIAISVLAIYGFEPTAIGHQTLYNFHLKGITIGIGLILLSSAIFTISINRKEKPITAPKLVQLNFIPKQTKDIVVDSADWEEATEDDFQSGEYVV